MTSFFSYENMLFQSSININTIPEQIPSLYFKSFRSKNKKNLTKKNRAKLYSEPRELSESDSNRVINKVNEKTIGLDPSMVSRHAQYQGTM